jgi:hypothetical protein
LGSIFCTFALKIENFHTMTYIVIWIFFLLSNRSLCACFMVNFDRLKFMNTWKFHNFDLKRLLTVKNVLQTNNRCIFLESESDSLEGFVFIFWETQNPCGLKSAPVYYNQFLFCNFFSTLALALKIENFHSRVKILCWSTKVMLLFMVANYSLIPKMCMVCTLGSQLWPLGQKKVKFIKILILSICFRRSLNFKKS